MIDEDDAAFHHARLVEIRQRMADMIDRTVAEAQAFTASPAFERAICEIVENGRKALLADRNQISPDDMAGL